MSISTPPFSIAFLGMGLMGTRMASRLIAAGHRVAVWNRTASACDPLIAQGAEELDYTHLAEFPYICLCLADDHAVRQVYEQIQNHLVHGQHIIDFSSLSVSTTHELAASAATHGVTWIDSPVSGGVMGAENGSLVIFAGGDAQTIDSLAPLFAPLSQRVTVMGSVGTGQATKICNQLIVAANSALVAEAVHLAKQAGVDTTRLAPALAGGFADSKPLQILAPRMATHVFEPVQWKVQTLSKDLNNAAQLAQSLQVHIPVALSAQQQLIQHQHQGHAEHDLASLILHTESQSV